MKPITLMDRIIAPDQPTLIIAEIGVNHDGSLHRVLELVEVAAECGADAVKLQVFRAGNLLHGSAVFAGYQRDRCAESDPAAMLSRYELPEPALERAVAAIRARGLIPLATPFSPQDVEVIDRLGLPAVKIASPDLVNRPLLKKAAQLGKPLIISTGAATMQEIETAAGWLGEWGTAYALLHCISAYPVPADAANLCWIGELAARFDVPVGYSDHTTEPAAGAIAVTLGACIVEKHLTYDRNAAGPDHAASADPAQFAEYVRMVRAAPALRGRAGKQVLSVEQDVRRASRQSVVLRRELHAGDVVREQDVTVQRPGTGIPAAQRDRVVGCKAVRTMEAGTLLQWDMLSPPATAAAAAAA